MSTEPKDYASKNPRLAESLKETVTWTGRIMSGYAYVQGTITGAVTGMPFGPVGVLVGGITGYKAVEKIGEVFEYGVGKGIDKFKDLARNEAKTSWQANRNEETVVNTAETLLLGLTFTGMRKGVGGKILGVETRVGTINNRAPINHEFAGKVYTFDQLPKTIQEKHPHLKRDYQHGIPFTGTGHPDFSRYATRTVRIDVTGVRWKDEMLANKAAGLASKPLGHTWHHHHDGQTMMLVPFDLHDAIKHTGGVSVVKNVVKE